ncbi:MULTISPECIES: hypothetical protein [unclassified Sphingopyxis]|uniref:hypothetical protein n=1 Tax=unclassified Sphingopyxis TaxID=2614943 RepID=UPI0007368483|nr:MULTISPECIES: hypothetical protein [unclassified Sphingopyxis]KTE25685.1 hypothetical protein ATE62_22215 [Sphingopyxis sp. HIX]KTE73321.1 hypothetical protein ATE72_21905 [Sphingopyxis sp. HXXIV]
MRTLIAATLGLTLTTLAPPALAETVEDPNYTTQNLMIYNDRGQVLLQRNFMGWSTPGLRYDKRVSIRQSLGELASNYGLTISDLRLSGLFSYQYGYTPAISTRSHYSATAAGGTATAPKGIDEVRWFDRADAIAAIASDTQKSPPALVAISRQMLSHPETIWSGSFYIWREGEAYLSKVVEPLEPIG